MTAPALDPLRYPTGTWAPLPPDTPLAAIHALVDRIAATPAALRAAVDGLGDAQLDTPYRDGGWTVRQVVHHVADSHMNAYVRVKKALTEDAPLIAPYDEARWAELPDARLPVGPSLALLDALHLRWDAVLRSLGPDDFARAYRHPELGEVPLRTAVAIYAWHGAHHTAHVAGLRRRMGW
ncbi:putative metal-dependent hydrolase [Gemmatimonadetes bacterium T265]|nr:putative metal-dependent hydrolase [Gemmatimonadetes bacterium T265]